MNEPEDEPDHRPECFFDECPTADICDRNDHCAEPKP